MLRVDRGGRRLTEVTGAATVAGRALGFARLAPFARPALVNGAAGFVVAVRGRPLAVSGFTVIGGRIARIDLLADRARLRRIDVG